MVLLARSYRLELARSGIDSELQRPEPKPQRNVCAPVRRSQLDAVHGHVRQRGEFLRELSILLRADVGREWYRPS